MVCLFLSQGNHVFSRSMINDKPVDSSTAQAKHGTMSRTVMDGLCLDFASQKVQINELLWRSSFVHPTNHNSVASSKCISRIRILAVCTCVIIPPDLKKNMNYSRTGYLEEATPMPPRYHLTANERIAPIWVVPTFGYAMRSKTLGDDAMHIGVSYLSLHQSVH